MQLTDVAVVLGMVLGSLLLLVVAWVWLRKQAFGVGGSFLTTFGVVLVGLGIWSTVTISLTPEGGLTASFEQQLASVQANLQLVEHEVQRFRSDVIASVDTLSAVPEAKVETLKRHQAVDQLIRDGRYKEALDLEPTNTIALMRTIEKGVSDGDFEMAAGHLDGLRSANKSGVGYSAYPDLALALQRKGDTRAALSVLTELEREITRSAREKSGYLSRPEQLQWIDRDLDKARSRVTDEETARAFDAVRKRIAEALPMLRSG